jgi:hypothetical protein
LRILAERLNKETGEWEEFDVEHSDIMTDEDLLELKDITFAITDIQTKMHTQIMERN